MKCRSSLVVALLLLASLSGCKSLLKKRLPVAAASDSAPVAAAPPPAVSPVPSVVAPAASAVAGGDAAVAAPEDFEDEAFEKVTARNFRSEFARLSQEINAGK